MAGAIGEACLGHEKGEGAGKPFFSVAHLLAGDDLRSEEVCDVLVEAVAVVSADDDLSLLVDEQHRANHGARARIVSSSGGEGVGGEGEGLASSVGGRRRSQRHHGDGPVLYSRPKSTGTSFVFGTASLSVPTVVKS